MKISIITTTYNNKKYLATYFNSFSNADYSNDVELIIIDDGSTDGTEQEIKKNKKKLERYTNIVYQKNSCNAGISYSRNLALTLAKGEYIFFLDADDWIAPAALGYMLSLIQQYNDIDIFIFDQFDDQNDSISEQLVVNENNYRQAGYLQLLVHHQIGVCVKLYKKTIFEHIKFMQNIFYEDLYFQADLYNYRPLKTLLTTTKIYYYRKNNESITNSKFTEQKFNDYLSCFNHLHEQLPHLLFEFSVLRASRHIKKQAKKSDLGLKEYNKRLANYQKDKKVLPINPIFKIWMDKNLELMDKLHLYDIVDEDDILAKYLYLEYLQLDQLKQGDHKLYKLYNKLKKMIRK